MATCQLPHTAIPAATPVAVTAPGSGDTLSHAQPNATEAIHRVKELALRNPEFAASLRTSDSPQQAADLAHLYGIKVSAAALWRHRGTLAHGGLPTWRG